MNKSRNKTITEDLKFYFVIKNDFEKASNELRIAFETGREYFPYEEGMHLITEQKCKEFKKSELTNKCVFVIEEFSGVTFEYLKESEALILGPRLFMSCLLDDTPIPIGSTPVYTPAMQNLIISASGITNDHKMYLKNMINWMSGHYISNINVSCTHLVSNTVKSTKYEKAAETKVIKIMHPDWIEDVWKVSLEKNILATDPIFDKHKLPIFFKLNITTTSIKSDQKLKLKTLIEKNGGIFCGEFKSEITDILLLEESGIGTQKYLAAIKFKKDCLRPQWVFDSVEKGYAVEMNKYMLAAKNLKASTPTKSSCDANFFTDDASNVSNISHCVRGMELVNESTASEYSIAPNRPTRSTRNTIVKQHVPTYKEIISNLNIQQAKKSGPFLDYCCLYLSGFSDREKDKLNKILNNASAVRYDELDDNAKEKISHILVGEPNSKDLHFINENYATCVAVTIEWLVESMKIKRPASESRFLYNTKKVVVEVHKQPEPPSPASKKNLHTMSFKKPILPKFDLDSIADPKPSTSTGVTKKNIKMNVQPESVENELINQYLQKRATVLENTLADNIEETESINSQSSIPDDEKTFLNNIKVCFHGFDKEDENQFASDCKEWGAEIYNDCFTKSVDYLIVPIILNQNLSIKFRATHIVNDLWFEDIFKEHKVVDIEYYHIPYICSSDCKPLHKLNIAISTYVGSEKIYIIELAKALGADVKDEYNRKINPILICPLPEGKKYEASKKWGLTAVTCKWLLGCAEDKKKLPFKGYIVGITNMDASDVIPSTQNSLNSSGSRKRKSDESNEKCDNENMDLENTTASNSKSNSLGDSVLSPASRRVKDFETPVREILYKSWKEREKLEAAGLVKPFGADCINTPETPKLPECLRTPDAMWGFSEDSSPLSRARNKRMLEGLQKFAEPQVQPRKPATPFSEIKRKFWKEALGDEYIEYGTQIKTQLFSQKPEENPTIDTQDTNAEHVQILRDFIKTRPIERRSNENDLEVDSIPFKMNSEAMGTENDMIGWRDPAEFNDLRRSNKEYMEYKGIPSFIISTIDITIKDKIIQQIKQLNGDVCDLNIKFDHLCTHLICEQPNRGEKIISAMASGKWILGLNYITDSIEAGYFLKEEYYEWGNPKATKLPVLKPMEQTIANAAYRWRNKIATQEEKKYGAFTGYRVILHVVKKEQFQCVIKAGGGIVIDIKPPYEHSEEALRATHCFVEQKKIKLNREDHKALAEAGVRIYSTMYIHSYLMSETTVDDSKFEISYN